MARLMITGNHPVGVTVPPAGSAGRLADGSAAGLTALRRRWGLLLVAGWLVQIGLRAWFSRGQLIPLANPDESAYLIAARVLAGGPPADFSGSTLYQGGYPLLITPVYWFTHDPVTVYRAVLLLNAVVGGAIMPLGYLACRRMSSVWPLTLGRPACYSIATVAALLPAAFFYSQYAMTDAIYPVLVLAWLLTVHTWLTATSTRGRYAAAIGSALLAGYAYGVHSRGLVIVVVYAAAGLLAVVRRLVPRGSAAAAAVALLATAAAGWALDRYLAAAIYPEGARSLSSEVKVRLHSVRGAMNVAEMAVGQLWRLVLDSWGIAGIGLAAAVVAIVWRGLRLELRIMAAITVAVTLVTAFTTPAALPPDQSQTWASGRYLDGMIIVFFLVGVAVLLRTSIKFILACAGCVIAFSLIAAVTVATYAGSQLPEQGFGANFNFAEPGVLTQNWNRASVVLATAVALALMLAWVGFAVLLRRGVPARLASRPRVVRNWRTGVAGCFGVCVAAVSLVAVVQITSNVSQAGTSAQERATTALSAASEPGTQVAIASNVGWTIAIPQSFEVWWTEPEVFNADGQPPAGVTEVEVAWSGQSAQASWPKAPSGWRVVASSQVGGWVVWRR